MMSFSEPPRPRMSNISDVAVPRPSKRTWRSLHHSYADWCRKTGGAPPDGKLLFRALGLEPDWTRIRYYILLDELF